RFMLAIAKLDGASALKYASPELRSDRDVAWAAVLQSKEALRYVAPEDLRGWCAEAAPSERSRLLGAVLGVGAGAAQGDSGGLAEEVDACAAKEVDACADDRRQPWCPICAAYACVLILSLLLFVLVLHVRVLPVCRLSDR
ncbi:unnamed protein product, partial [Prorocentrum cordatum]